jgi:hypothetical protein
LLLPPPRLPLPPLMLLLALYECERDRLGQPGVAGVAAPGASPRSDAPAHAR